MKLIRLLCVCLIFLSVSSFSYLWASDRFVGVNLDSVQDWAPVKPFANLVKSARGFASPEKPWSIDKNIILNSHGYPTKSFGLLLLSDREKNEPNTFIVFIEGKIKELALANPTLGKVYLMEMKQKDKLQFKIVIDPESKFFCIKILDPQIKKLEIYEDGEINQQMNAFSYKFIEKLKPFEAVRVMDMLRTNNNPIEEWKDRTQKDQVIQAGEHGVAWEYIFDLANNHQKNLWINIPDGADAKYVAKLSDLIMTNIKTSTNIYVEYSNEVWNDSFKQHQKNQLRAAKLFALSKPELEIWCAEYALLDVCNKIRNFPSGINKGEALYVLRTLSTARIMKNIVKKSNIKIIPVLAGQIVRPTVMQKQIEYLIGLGVKPSEELGVIAGAPYFDFPVKKSQWDLWLAKGWEAIYTAGLQKTITELFVDSNSYFLLSKHYQIPLVAYEGGPGGWGEENLEARNEFHNSEKMQKLLMQYFDAWAKAGGGAFFYFSFSTRWTKYGAWGLLNSASQISNKYKSIVSIADMWKTQFDFPSGQLK
jgi:hypothetical protein